MMWTKKKSEWKVCCRHQISHTRHDVTTRESNWTQHQFYWHNNIYIYQTASNELSQSNSASHALLPNRKSCFTIKEYYVYILYRLSQNMQTFEWYFKTKRLNRLFIWHTDRKMCWIFFQFSCTPFPSYMNCLSQFSFIYLCMF